jgi:KipI family sensor histidine kinase inhibitor
MPHEGRSHEPRRVLPCGDRAVLLETAGGESVAEVTAAIEAGRLEGLVEVVPGAATVLLRFDPFAVSEQRVREYAEAIAPLAVERADDGPVVVPVRYDGEDLSDAAALTGLTVAQVIERHVRAEYEVAFCGFAPGFAYLRGLDPALRVPRLATPRTRVPAGSLAMADVWTAVYPRESPGGWRLLGRTDVSLWDSSREAPALLTAGRRVRFEQVAP